MSEEVNKYPECEKLHAVSEKSQELGFFLDWLTSNGIVLAKWHDDIDQLYPAHETIQNILARYFDIDMNKVDEERAQILEELRSKNK